MPETNTTTSHHVNLRFQPLPLAIFIVGVLLLVTSAFIVHGHPRPYPIDLATTQDAQAMISNPTAIAILDSFSAFNDPIPSTIALLVWMIGLIVIGFIARGRGKSPLKWFESAGGLGATVGIASGINFLLVELVARPRPGSFGEHIHILTHRPFFSFPSGHTEHEVAYYGFLLFLSFTPPVRAWRFRWFLIPFQVYCVIDILFIGISRVLEGEHWMTDVLGGYLSGLLWLFMGIFLYRWITEWIKLKLAARQQVSTTS